jgi:hypothetical protein
MTRTHLYVAAHVILTRGDKFSNVEDLRAAAGASSTGHIISADPTIGPILATTRAAFLGSRTPTA